MIAQKERERASYVDFYNSFNNVETGLDLSLALAME
jgi:hypothetical protein